jgi:hypothetical protein
MTPLFYQSTARLAELGFSISEGCHKLYAIH